MAGVCGALYGGRKWRIFANGAEASAGFVVDPFCLQFAGILEIRGQNIVCKNPLFPQPRRGSRPYPPHGKMSRRHYIKLTKNVLFIVSNATKFYRCVTWECPAQPAGFHREVVEKDRV